MDLTRVGLRQLLPWVNNGGFCGNGYAPLESGTKWNFLANGLLSIDTTRTE
jgi:hypothetical protein